MDASREFLLETWVTNSQPSLVAAAPDQDAADAALSLLVMYDHGLITVTSDEDGEQAFSTVETVSEEAEEVAKERFFSLLSRPFGEIFSAVMGGTNQVN